MLPVTATKNYNWKDYWQSKARPQDDDGHGTAMLSVVHRIAPFANICVAHIAGDDQDMREHPIDTSNNLAKVLELHSMQKDFRTNSTSIGHQMGCRGAERRHYLSIPGMGTGTMHRRQSCRQQRHFPRTFLQKSKSADFCRSFQSRRQQA